MPFSLLPKRSLKSSINNLWCESKKHLNSDTILCSDAFAHTFMGDVDALFISNASDEERVAVCQEVYDRICRTLDDSSKDKRNKILLLCLLRVMAERGIRNRALVRNILTNIYTFSGYIDREILLFKYKNMEDTCLLDMCMRQELWKKQEYMLSMVSGWKLPNQKPWEKHPSISHYIELPFRRVNIDANSHLMAEALYRQHDEEFVLLLLRYGMQPSCLYLWPICLILDLKQNRMGSRLSEEEIRTSKECTMIRLFCRARHYIHVHKVHSHQRDKIIEGLPLDISYDNILLISPKAAGIVPPERCSIPSSLMHQCRLTIRSALHEADCLPHGIQELTLPNCMKDFIDLKVD